MKKSNPTTKLKCKLTRNGISPCEGLLCVIEEHGRGVQEKFLINFKTGDTLRSIFVLHSGKFRKNGIVMNYCPFCGEKIYEAKESE